MEEGLPWWSRKDTELVKVHVAAGGFKWMAWLPSSFPFSSFHSHYPPQFYPEESGHHWSSNGITGLQLRFTYSTRAWECTPMTTVGAVINPETGSKLAQPSLKLIR